MKLESRATAHTYLHKAPPSLLPLWLFITLSYFLFQPLLSIDPYAFNIFIGYYIYGTVKNAWPKARSGKYIFILSLFHSEFSSQCLYKTGLDSYHLLHGGFTCVASFVIYTERSCLAVATSDLTLSIPLINNIFEKRYADYTMVHLWNLRLWGAMRRSRPVAPTVTSVDKNECYESERMSLFDRAYAESRHIR